MVSQSGDTHLFFLGLQKPLIHSKTMFWRGDGGTSRYCLSLKKYLCKTLINLSSDPENEKWGCKSQSPLLHPPKLHSKASRSYQTYAFNIYLQCNIGAVSHPRTAWDDLGPGFEISVRWQRLGINNLKGDDKVGSSQLNSFLRNYNHLL